MAAVENYNFALHRINAVMNGNSVSHLGNSKIGSVRYFVLHRTTEHEMQTSHDIDINTGPLVPARDVLKRYGVVGRTLDRWLANPALGFPRPLVINRRRYFNERTLLEWERQQARAHVGGAPMSKANRVAHGRSCGARSESCDTPNIRGGNP